MRPVKVASKMLYETIAVFLLAHLLMPALLAVHGIGARTSRSQSRLLVLHSSPRIFEEKTDCLQSISVLVK